MQLKIDDGVIGYDYSKTASSQPPVLFLHGAMGVRDQLDPLRTCFGDRSQIAIDFAAHGESVIRSSGMNCERLAKDVLAVLDALDIEHVDIIGHSLGGYVGLVLARQAPARVRSVVTLGTKFYWTDEAISMTLKDLDHELLRGHARAYETLSALHIASGIGETLRLMQSLITDFGRWQLNEQTVRKIEAPLLVTAGDHDTFVPPSEVARLFDALDKKRNAMAILPNTPHALHHLALECFEQAVRRFWERSGLA
ncbi:MAG TPA: alpha/beta hydrolase [Telluria sp.]